MVPDPPETIDLGAGGGPWPAFTVSGITGAHLAGNTIYDYRLAAASSDITYLSRDSAHSVEQIDVGLWAIFFEGEAIFSGEGEWPWSVDGWAAEGGATGSPLLTLAPGKGGIVDLGGSTSAVQATLTAAFSGTNNDLLFTAVPAGRLGNDIGVTFTAEGANAALSVTVIGREIVINLGTGTNAGTTANQVIAAVGASPAASALVTVANAAGNNGSGNPTSRARSLLTGGTGGLPLPPETVAL